MLFWNKLSSNVVQCYTHTQDHRVFDKLEKAQGKNNKRWSRWKNKLELWKNVSGIKIVTCIQKVVAKEELKAAYKTYCIYVPVMPCFGKAKWTKKIFPIFSIAALAQPGLKLLATRTRAKSCYQHHSHSSCCRAHSYYQFGNELNL